MSRRSQEEQIRQLAALPPDVLVRQVRLTHVLLSVGTVVILALMAGFVFLVQEGDGLIPSHQGLLPALPVSLIGVVFALAGWIVSRPWRRALTGIRPPRTRRDLAAIARWALLGIFFSEGGTLTAATGFLIDGRPAFFGVAVLALVFLVFQRTDADRAGALLRHLEEARGS